MAAIRHIGFILRIGITYK